MRDLLIDAGNSRLKAATNDGRTLAVLPPFTWASGDPVAGLAEHWLALPRPDRIWCANVAGDERGQAIATWCDRRWGLRAEFLRVTAAAAGVRNRYARPDQLGIDRWLSAVAGHDRARGAVCVVDCGTAVNAEFVTAAGDYLGGVIAPGARLMSAALARGTAALPAIELLPGRHIGGDTSSCINAGIAHALGGLLDRIVAAARAEFGTEPAWLMTGGSAATLAVLAPVTFTMVPDLVLRGMALITGTNR